MAEVASAYVSILPSARGFGRRLDSGISGDVDKAGVRAGKGFGLAFGKAFAAVGAALGVGHFLSDSIGEAREAQKVGALTNQVIKTTGGVAKVSAKQVGSLATSLSNKVGIDDEIIQSGENVLLTFKNVRNELGKGNKIFDRATKAAVDLSTTPLFGGDVAGATKQLGKALNDPVRGLTALGRAGVQFSDRQKNQIKTLVKSGKTMQAQKIILREVESQVGGAAEAQATAGDKLGVSVKNLEESVGTALLPVFDKVAGFLTNTLIPSLYKTGPLIGKVGAFLRPAVDAIRSFGDGGGKAGEKLDQLKTTAASVFASLKSIFTSTVSIVTSLWKTFGATLTSAVGRAFTSILNIVRGGLLVVKGIFEVVSALLRGDWSGVWQGIKDIASGALIFLKGIIQGGLNTIKTIFGLALDALGAIAGTAFANVRKAVGNGIGGLIELIGSLPGRVVGALGDLGSVLYDAGKSLIQGLINGIADSFGAVKDKLGSLTGKLTSWKGPPARDRVLLKPAGRMLMDGLISGIQEGSAGVESSLRGLTANIGPVATSGASSAASRSTGSAIHGSRLRLVVDGREFNAHIEDLADSRVDAARSEDGMVGRAFG